MSDEEKLPSTWRVILRRAGWFTLVLSTIFKGVAIVSIVQSMFGVGLKPVFGAALNQYREAIHPLYDYVRIIPRPLSDLEKDAASVFFLVATSCVAAIITRPDSSRSRFFSTGTLAIAVVAFLTTIAGQIGALDAELLPILAPYFRLIELTFGWTLTAARSSPSIFIAGYICVVAILGYLSIIVIRRWQNSNDGGRFSRMTGRVARLADAYDPLGFYLGTAVIGAAVFFALDAFTPS